MNCQIHEASVADVVESHQTQSLRLEDFLKLLFRLPQRGLFLFGHLLQIAEPSFTLLGTIQIPVAVACPFDLRLYKRGRGVDIILSACVFATVELFALFFLSAIIGVTDLGKDAGVFATGEVGEVVGTIVGGRFVVFGKGRCAVIVIIVLRK